MPTYAVSREALLTSIRHDCEVFLGFYLGEELELEIPDFHKEIWDEFLSLLDQINDPSHLNGILKKLLAVPREHAKTTLTKLAVVLFMRYSRLSFCAYTSNTFGVALNAIRDIKDFFASEQDTELYGKTHVKKSSESEGIYILEIPVPGQSRLKQVILKAYGQGTQIRGTLIAGRRPDFLIFDDIESKETAESPTQQSKLDSWAFGTALKSMARRGVVVFIGNMIADTTLLARLSKVQEWNPTVLGSIIKTEEEGVRPLWAGRWSLQALLTDYMAYRQVGQGHTWEAEMMNLTSDEVFGESLEKAVRPAKPVPDDLRAGFICLDPAFGKNAWNDESAITVHALQHGADIPAVIESEKGRWGEVELFDRMLGASLRWGIRTWAIESQAAQRLLIPLFRSYLQQRRMSAEFVLMIPVFSGKDSKASRILAFRDAVAKGSYGIVDAEQELVDALEIYSPMSTTHDDLCDSGAYGVIVWNLHGEMIRAHGIQDMMGGLFGTSTGEGSRSALEMGIP